MSERPVPPSAEVIAEEIEVKLAEDGMPRDEQGPLIRGFVRSVAGEVAKVTQAAYAFIHLAEGDICPTCGTSVVVLCECGQGEPHDHLICLGCGEDPPDCDCE